MMHRRTVEPDYYATLGVQATAEAVVIRAAYKALAQKYHPDRYPGSRVEAEARMKALNAAYQVLSVPEQRRRYDGRCQAHAPGPSATPNPGTARRPRWTASEPVRFDPADYPRPAARAERRFYDTWDGDTCTVLLAFLVTPLLGMGLWRVTQAGVFSWSLALLLHATVMSRLGQRLALDWRHYFLPVWFLFKPLGLVVLGTWLALPLVLRAGPLG